MEIWKKRSTFLSNLQMTKVSVFTVLASPWLFQIELLYVIQCYSIYRVSLEKGYEEIWESFSLFFASNQMVQRETLFEAFETISE